MATSSRILFLHRPIFPEALSSWPPPPPHLLKPLYLQEPSSSMTPSSYRSPSLSLHKAHPCAPVPLCPYTVRFERSIALLVRGPLLQFKGPLRRFYRPTFLATLLTFWTQGKQNSMLILSCDNGALCTRTYARLSHVESVVINDFYAITEIWERA
jgi:hypothetical protein